MVSWIWALPSDSLSTQTHDIHPETTVRGSTIVAFSFISVRVKHRNPTVNLGKVLINSVLNCTKLYLNSLTYLALATHMGNATSKFSYKPNHSIEMGWAPCWFHILSGKGAKCSNNLNHKLYWTSARDNLLGAYSQPKKSFLLGSRISTTNFIACSLSLFRLCALYKISGKESLRFLHANLYFYLHLCV